MNIIDIPFNKLIGISLPVNSEFLLQLDAKKEYTNHMGAVHAAALFALAEGSGAQFLLNYFPKEMIEQVIPLVRKVEVSYKKPATGIIVSTAKLKDNSIEDIRQQLTTKKRVSLITTVDLFDEEKNRVFTANFEWFVILK
jgi:acyl-CoA thioesterase FadM